MTGSLKKKTYEVKAGLEKVQQFSVMGISEIITEGQEGAADQINELWQAFFAQQVGLDLSGRENDNIYAVYSDYQGDYTQPYRLTIGYRMKDSAQSVKNLHHVLVKTADYAMMSAQGEQPKALIDTWTAIWQSDLPRRFETDFEVYGPRFFEEGVHEILVCVGINIQ